MQRAGAAVDADAVRRASERGELTLEGGNLAPESELASLEDRIDRRTHLVADRAVLRLR